MEGFEARATEALPPAIPLSLVVQGRVELGAQLIGGQIGQALGPTDGARVLDDLRRAGSRLVYGVPSLRWPAELLEGLGFRSPFEVQVRNFHLGLSGISARLDERFQPFRKVAKLARRIRQKLIEVELEEFVTFASRLFTERRSEIGLAVERSEDYLRARYGGHPDRGYRMLVLRRQAGVGIDAFAVIRSVPDPTGPRAIQLVDHWTRIGERRSTTWLLGELAMWGLVEEFSLIQAFAAAGSVLDHLLIAAGAIRKSWSAPFLIRSLSEPDLAISADQVQLRAGDLEMF